MKKICDGVLGDFNIDLQPAVKTEDTLFQKGKIIKTILDNFKLDTKLMQILYLM